MGKAELMQEKIAKQRQLPNEIKEKLNNITFKNLLISIAIMIYLIAINLLFINKETEFFTNCTKATAFILMLLDLVFFEIAYRKDNGVLAIHAIELLLVCLFALAIPYIFIYTNPIVRKTVMISPIYCSIYYLGKAIVIHIIEKNRYINNLSDVNEILKDDTENTSYLDEFDSEEDNSKVRKNSK